MEADTLERVDWLGVGFCDESDDGCSGPAGSEAPEETMGAEIRALADVTCGRDLVDVARCKGESMSVSSSASEATIGPEWPVGCDGMLGRRSPVTGAEGSAIMPSLCGGTVD